MTRERVRGVPVDPARRARSAPAACLRVVRRGALVGTAGGARPGRGPRHRHHQRPATATTSALPPPPPAPCHRHHQRLVADAEELRGPGSGWCWPLSSLSAGWAWPGPAG
ncbi:hypothetical protein [Micromonospora sp. NBC_01412]|uniref:hypothetical protein n=1 Tax=Micromonospora sp. NBC_01412 TaxID=2903590 RepID=UPI00324B1A38